MLGPIFLREALTVPRRARHYIIRSACLGGLWILGLTAWQATVGWSASPTLGDASRFGLTLFQIYTGVQLILVLFFSAQAAANAIILEKDRRTFVLLLITDLRNYEIVLGKVLGNLMHMGLLLASMAPVLALLILLGGVSVEQVAQAMLVLAAAGVASGSLAGLLALWHESAFQSLAYAILGLVLYLLLVQELAVFAALGLAGGISLFLAALGQRLAKNLPRAVHWLVAIGLGTVAGAGLWWGLRSWPLFLAAEPTLGQWLDPYRAWQTVVFPELGGEGAPVPVAVGFAAVMLVWSVILNVWGIVMLRVWNPSGEPIQQREAPDSAAAEEKDRLKAHAAPGRAREVWANPILWREIRTRAYGRWALLVKIMYFLVLGLICWYALGKIVFRIGETSSYPPAAFGLVPVGVLSLLLISAQAVTAITSERARGALDLLLVTDLTPQEFIFGKIGGILYNTKEFLLPPLILALVYGHFHMLAVPPRDHPELTLSRNVEATLCLLGVTLVLLAFAVVLGLHVALRTDKNRLAIVNTLGTIFFLTVGTLLCIYLILINGGRFEYQWFSFIFFIAAGIGGLWWVLSGNRPSAALTLAAWLCPLGVFYTVTNLVVARPGSAETADPLIPFVVIVGAFGFTVAAMLVPLVSEFDVALGRTTGGGE